MMKKVLLYSLFLGLYTSGVGQTFYTKIGDLITNPDGSKGVVFWINPEKTKGYMINLTEYPYTTTFGTSSVTAQTPALSRDRCLFDMDGLAYTHELKNQVDCNLTSNITCLIDMDHGWFIPSAGIWNLFYHAYPFIHEKMVNVYGATPLSYHYWTSTQASASEVWTFSFGFRGHFDTYAKYYYNKVRTVREFSIPPPIAYDTTLTYRWNTGDTILNFFTKPATDSLFSVTATSSVGCVSTASKQIFVASTGSATAQIFDTICVGYAYKQNGFDLPADSNQIAGTATHTKTLSNGICDVSLTLHLTKKQTDSTPIIDSFCAGGSYVHNGVIYQTEGDYIQFLTCENQCDSILYLKLSCKYPKFSEFSDTACNHFVWNNQYYYTSGTYSQTFTAANGCDSVVRKSITICHTTHSYLDLDSCDRITYKNSTFFNDTIFVDTLVNSAGCDSLITVSLTVIKSGFDTIRLSDCDSVHYRGTFYYTSTTVDTLIELATCGTLETAHLTVNHSYFNQQNLFGTDSLRYLSNIYYRDTILTLPYQTIAGCDSVEEIHISITMSCRSTSAQLDLDSCDKVTYNGIPFFNDTSFVETLINAEGCDSLLTVNLTVNHSYFDQQNLYGIDSLEYLSNVYYRDTILIFSYQTSKSCDSIIETHIFVTSSPPIDFDTEIVVYWHKVLAVPNRKNLDELKYATYYWYKDHIPLPQSNKDWIEVGQPIPAGTYNVSIHYDGSEILYLERIFTQPFGVSAYPNPVHTSEELTIEAYGNTIKRVDIFDMNGVLQKLPIRTNIGDKTPVGALRATPLHIGFKTAGLYILQIHLDNQTIETIKIIVK